jgi:hypothetical protein
MQNNKTIAFRIQGQFGFSMAKPLTKPLVLSINLRKNRGGCMLLYSLALASFIAGISHNKALEPTA